jgi:hypothetical protein
MTSSEVGMKVSKRDRYARIVSHILNRARRPRAKYAKMLLEWLSCAARVLTWREIQAATSIDAPRLTFDYKGHQSLRHSR